MSLSEKLTSGELKFRYTYASYVSAPVWSREVLLKDGISVRELGFARNLVLLSSEHNELLMSILPQLDLWKEAQIYRISLETEQVPSFIYVVSLDDDGTYWGLTPAGAFRRTLDQWIYSSYFQMISRMAANYTPEYKNIDILSWKISRMTSYSEFQQLDEIYQAEMKTLEEAHLSLESLAKRLTRPVQLQTRKRLAKTEPEETPEPKRPRTED